MKTIKLYFIINIFLAGFFSCAKENLPKDTTSDVAVKQLYFSEINTASPVKMRINTNVGAADTTLPGFKIDGTQTIPNDIQLSFKVLPDAYVQAFDNANNGTYLPLPANAYSIVTDTVMHAGSSTSGFIPITIHKNMLAPLTDYVLPIQLISGDTAFKADPGRSIKYLIISSRTLAIGIKIGNIPQLADQRADLFDFYGDLMLKDTSGNLWFLPLENNGNKNIGQPVKVASGFGKYECLFFHPFYQMIFGIDVSSPSSSTWKVATGAGHPFSFAVTPFPNVTIGPARRLTNTTHLLAATSPVTYNEDWGYQAYTFNKRRRFFAGVNGFTHLLYIQPSATATSLYHTKFYRLDANGQLSTTNRKDQTTWSFAIKSGCTIANKQFFLADNIAMIYGSNDPMAGNYPGYSYVTPASTPDFGPLYVKAISVYQRDLVCYTYSGDIIRYESPTFEDLLRP